MTEVTISLYQGMSHTCSYLPDEIACMHVVDPNFRITPGHYGRLLEAGFRRSGDMVYRPGCRDCHACVPARIRVNGFRPNRSQRRLRRHFARHGRIIVGVARRRCRRPRSGARAARGVGACGCGSWTREYTRAPEKTHDGRPGAAHRASISASIASPQVASLSTTLLSSW